MENPMEVEHEKSDSSPEEFPPLDELQNLDPRVYSVDIKIPDDFQIDFGPAFQKWIDDDMKATYGEEFTLIQNRDLDEEEDDDDDENENDNREIVLEDEENIEKARVEAETRQRLKGNQFAGVLGHLQQRLFAEGSRKGFGYNMEDDFIDDDGTDVIPKYKQNPQFKSVPVKTLTEAEIKKEQERKEKRRLKAKQKREEQKKEQESKPFKNINVSSDKSPKNQQEKTDNN
ncbi:Uncharacterized protein QTN25_008222 [Entamoeba marina]